MPVSLHCYSTSILEMLYNSHEEAQAPLVFDTAPTYNICATLNLCINFRSKLNVRAIPF